MNWQDIILAALPILGGIVATVLNKKLNQINIMVDGRMSEAMSQIEAANKRIAELEKLLQAKTKKGIL